MIYLYRFIYLILKTTALVLRPFLNQKNQKWVLLRSEFLTPKWHALALRQSVWIHASSGEIEYAKPLIRDIKKQSPTTSIVVTYSSESAEKLFENIRDSVDFFIPLPWDDVYSTRYLIKKLNPQILLFSRTDLWPELIYQANDLQIPTGVISYFPKISFSSKIILKNLLSKLSFISCVDQKTQTQIEDLNLAPLPIIVTQGDARFDQAFTRLEKKSQIQFKPNQSTICMGSTWPEDEAHLFPLFLTLRAANNRLILSPHDVSPENIARLSLELKKLKIAYSLLSELNLEKELDIPFLLVDRIGYLADLYRFSTIAFVGGSFKSRVHSVMEPLCCGLPVITGPLMKNNPEALKYSAAEPFNFVTICQNSTQIAETILLLKEKNRVEQKNQIQTEMLKNKGAPKNILQFILSTVLKKSNF
jgi:3-deoxy-D-manno-octulosonic-acid transferase